MHVSNNNHLHGHPHKNEEIKSSELKEYFKHNIKHLEDHIKSFKKLQERIEDHHALKSLKSAMMHLRKGVDKLKHLLDHL